MSNFPSIEEFDSGRVTATRIEDVNDDADLLDSAQKDFLAREQAILGEDAQFFQTEGLTGSQPTQGEAEFYGANDYKDVQEFESSFPTIDRTNVFPTVSPMPQSFVPKDEPEVIKRWREERDLQIQRREEIAQQKKKEIVDQAKQAIDGFYENYNAQKEKAIAQTRKEEADFLASRDDESGGTAWERIAKYIDISEKSAAGGGSTRYRELLLSLKTDPNAPGAQA